MGGYHLRSPAPRQAGSLMSPSQSIVSPAAKRPVIGPGQTLHPLGYGTPALRRSKRPMRRRDRGLRDLIRMSRRRLLRAAGLLSPAVRFGHRRAAALAGNDRRWSRSPLPDSSRSARETQSQRVLRAAGSTDGG